MLIESESPIIFHAYEVDGAIYPPLYAECSNCVFSLGRAAVNFAVGVDAEYACSMRRKIVEADDWCDFHELNRSKISDEDEAHLDMLEESGEKIELEYELTNEELKEFNK